MIQISCSALLFDLDGVLIDSTHAVTRCWTKWAIAHGFNPQEVVRHAHGRPSIDTIRFHLPHADHELENSKMERAEIEDVDGVVPLPGAHDLLNALPADRWTIVTSCTRALAEVRLRAAGLSVPERMVTSNDIVNGKPHPEPYLKGASVLGFPARDCVALEDVPAGIRSGKAAGTRVVAFRTTVEEEDLQSAGPDWIVDGCQSITLLSSTDQALTVALETS